MLEQQESAPPREEIISLIRQQIETRGSLFKHEVEDTMASIEQADRSQLEVMRAHYQESMGKTVANLSGEPKGPATKEMERSGSQRLGYYEAMIDLLNKLIEMTPEEREGISESS